MPHTPPKIFFLLLLISLSSHSHGAGADARKSARLVLGKPSAVYEQRVSTLSNHEFVVANYGVIGHDYQANIGGWYWPRNSGREYIFGQGFWFGAKKIMGADTLKVYSISYHPPSTIACFVPGSVDDGFDALDNSDPRAAKYYLYVSSDFSTAGKNVKDPNRSDWPIRWVNKKQIPGKNGYYGDYVADTLSRAKYDAVFLSSEEMFCIYKDTDIKKNQFYNIHNGLPVDLDVEQTIYTWDFGPYRDFVFIKYDVINKSKDTLRQCFFAPVSDPDIGNFKNDHSSFYSKNPALNLAYQYTETEPDYNGVLGLAFLESPLVKTSQDSVNIYLNSGIQRRVGEQIGLTTFWNGFLEWEASNGNENYDIPAAGVRNGDVGPGDAHMLMSTGPFVLNPNDEVRVVLCVLIAPGVGAWNAPPDVMNNGYLDSLISLEKFAKAIFLDAETIVPRDDVPTSFALEQNFPNPFNPQTTIRYSIGQTTQVRLDIYNVLGQVVQTLVEQVQAPGERSVTWDGRNKSGVHLSSGVYFFKIEAGSFIETKKMVLLK